MKKKIILISGIVVLLVIVIATILIIVNNNKLEDKALSLIDTHVKDISSFISKYDIKNTGVVNASANYKGAHGESYPAEFSYNYEVSDKLYLENDEYYFLDINESVLDIVKNLKDINKFDVFNYKTKSTQKNIITYTYDLDVFKNFQIKVFTKGLIKTIDYIEVDADDCKITIDNKYINVLYNNNDIEIVKNDTGYYLSINGKLKCNIFINEDNYTFSIVLNNMVYYLEIKEDGLVIKFNSSSAIYNSIDIKVNYEDTLFEKKKLSNNFDDNPIIRYLSKSDLTLWR